MTIRDDVVSLSLLHLTSISPCLVCGIVKGHCHVSKELRVQGLECTQGSQLNLQFRIIANHMHFIHDSEMIYFHSQLTQMYFHWVVVFQSIIIIYFSLLTISPHHGNIAVFQSSRVRQQRSRICTGWARLTHGHVTRTFVLVARF